MAPSRRWRDPRRDDASKSRHADTKRQVRRRLCGVGSVRAEREASRGGDFQGGAAADSPLDGAGVRAMVRGGGADDGDAEGGDSSRLPHDARSLSPGEALFHPLPQPVSFFLPSFPLHVSLSFFIYLFLLPPRIARPQIVFAFKRVQRRTMGQIERSSRISSVQTVAHPTDWRFNAGAKPQTRPRG